MNITDCDGRGVIFSCRFQYSVIPRLYSLKSIDPVHKKRPTAAALARPRQLVLRDKTYQNGEVSRSEESTML